MRGLHHIALDICDDGWIPRALNFDALEHWLAVWPIDIQRSRPVGPDKAPASGGAQTNEPSHWSAPRRDA